MVDSTHVPSRPTTPTPDVAGERLLRIQEVAAETGLTPRTIRYYEELGLLAPAARSEGAYRLYDAEDLERLRFIRGLRDDAGFSLAEIGQLLEDEAARARNRAALPDDERPGERRAHPRATRSSGSTARSASSQRKIERLEAMIAEAEERRAHLAGHLEDLDAGPRADPRARRPRAATPRTTSRSPTMIRPPAGMALANGGARSAIATTACSSAASSSRSSAPGCRRSPRAGWSSSSPATRSCSAWSPAMQWIPVMVLGLFGGLITDALPKRQTLIVTQAIKMGLAFVMFGAGGHGHRRGVADPGPRAPAGLTNAVDMPTRQAFSVEMVGREDIGNAVALNSAMFNGGARRRPRRSPA